MADHHHHHHRPHRLSLPQRTTTPTTLTRPLYPAFPYTPSTSTPTPTPSKLRHVSSSLSKPPNKTSSSSLSSLFLLLFSLRSLYSLLPFLRSSPSSFSLFPFSFLVSLLSFLLSLFFSFFTSASSLSKYPFRKIQTQPIFSLTSITKSEHRLLILKSLLQAIVFLLRFQALKYCGTSAMILAELSGNVAARFVFNGHNRNFDMRNRSKVCGFFALVVGMLLFSLSWDRIECFPLSSVNLFSENCVRVWPMLLPFLAGFLGGYEKVLMNWGSARELGRKRVRLISLFYTTVVLLFPAVISMLVFEAEGDSVSVSNLGWPLANTVVFGVLLSENSYTDEKVVSSKDFHREFLVTFFCTLVLELFYFPELSLWGLLICGLLLWIAVRELDHVNSSYVELGVESSESFSSSVMKPIRHILSERKSRKIALFLLINTGYMVVEFVAGFTSNSLGLISDACHMLFDCAALAIGLYASYISRLPANGQFNYGRGRFEVLSGYTNAIFLVLVGALIVLESFERILDPQEISTSSLLAVSIGGLLVNVIGLIFFHEEHHHAHGGSDSCSHSRSHSRAHSHHHHSDEDHIGNDYRKHQECITVIHDCHVKSCSGHDDQCKGDHEHHDCSDDHNKNNAEAEEYRNSQSHGHDHHHEHKHDDQHLHNHDHGQQCDHHHHDHDHGQQCDLHHHNDGDGHVRGSIHNSSSRSSLGQSTVGFAMADSHAVLDSHKHVLMGSSETVEPQKRHHHHIDHNMEGIFLHVLADTMGSVGVVVSTLLIQYKGWFVADPMCSIFISVLIISSVIPLLRNSAEILLQRTPRAHEQDLNEAIKDVLKIKGVCGIQNLHVWSFTNTDVVGTIHLHVSKVMDKASAKAQASRILHDAGIKDLTIQLECVENNSKRNF